MARSKPQHPHYRIEEPVHGFAVAQTTAGYAPVKPQDADKFRCRSDALIASAGAGLEVVRVDA